MSVSPKRQADKCDTDKTAFGRLRAYGIIMPESDRT
jgi:hypothetical protein